MKRFLFFLVLALLSAGALAQAETLSGKILDAEMGEPLSLVKISSQKTGAIAFSKKDGLFSIKIAPRDRLVFARSGYISRELKIDASAKEIEIRLFPKTFRTKNVYVYAASKRLEKITESPSAVNVLEKADIAKKSRSAKAASLLFGQTGADVLLNGSNDFIVNARGFNRGLNRRVLVLRDGRDAAMPLLGAQEWNAFSLPSDEFKRVEFVRGPAAALYGPNAFNGVVNFVAYAPKDVLGSKVSLFGGDYETFGATVRRADAFGAFSYKLTLAYSRNLNYSKRRDSLKFLEYPGLALEKRPLTENDRKNFAYRANLRLDYELDETKKIVAEMGYSRQGNEVYVFGLGRTLVKDAERPFLRLSYNSKNINATVSYMNRFVPDTMWLLVPNAPLLDDSKDFAAEFQHNFKLADNLRFVWGVSQNAQFIRTFGTSLPNDVNAYYAGIYGQTEWRINPLFKLVASARYDYASLHKNQFSPRAALVVSLDENSSLRLSVGRAFQRPNYSELFRSTPDAPAFDPVSRRPIDFSAVEKKIADSVFALSGKRPNVNFGLSPFAARALGNDKLDVEKNLSYEIGYKTVVASSLILEIDAYYNRLKDFITNFLPGVNPAFPKWRPRLPEEFAQYDELAENILCSSMSERDWQRLSIYDGRPFFIVSNANFGEVAEYGAEISAKYYPLQSLSLELNYSYFGYEVLKAKIDQPLLPNASPHRLNLAVHCERKNFFDLSVSFSYSQKFDWMAGAYVGKVPSYWLVNLNGGVRLFDGVRLGFDVFNLFNRKFYQIFGGTYLPRKALIKLDCEL